MKKAELHKRLYPVQLPFTYWHTPGKSASSNVILFLHGYTDSALSFLRRLKRVKQLSDHELLAPNGPFPVPVKTAEGYKEAYSWYFINPQQQRTLIPRSVSLDLLRQLFTDLNLLHRKMIIVGFSQGGFLAPSIVQIHPHVDRVIGIGCRNLPELYTDWKNTPVDAIHGRLDEIIPIEDAKRDHGALKERGIPGDFFELPDLGHTVNERVFEIVRKRIEATWPNEK